MLKAPRNTPSIRNLPVAGLSNAAIFFTHDAIWVGCSPLGHERDQTSSILVLGGDPMTRDEWTKRTLKGEPILYTYIFEPGAGGIVCETRGVVTQITKIRMPMTRQQVETEFRNIHFRAYAGKSR